VWCGVGVVLVCAGVVLVWCWCGVVWCVGLECGVVLVRCLSAFVLKYPSDCAHYY